MAICVLLPISAKPTTMVETKNASTEGLSGVGRNWTLARTPPPNPGAGNRCQRSRQAIQAACAMAGAKCVDADPAVKAGGYSPMTRDP